MTLQTQLAAAHNENDELRARLDELATLAPDAPAWMATMRDLRGEAKHADADKAKMWKSARAMRHMQLSLPQRTWRAVEGGPQTDRGPCATHDPSPTLRLAPSAFAVHAGLRGFRRTLDQDSANFASTHLDVDNGVLRRNIDAVFDSSQWPEEPHEVQREKTETKAIAGWIIRHGLDEDFGDDEFKWSDDYVHGPHRKARQFLGTDAFT